MLYTKQLILVCTGRDTARAAQHGLPLLHLCLGIAPCGTLQRLQLPTAQGRCLLGLGDVPVSLASCDAERLAADLLFEAEKANALGVFADFEHDTPAARALLAAFDRVLSQAGLPLYVPLSCGQALSHAVLTVPTALSGGSLTTRVSSLQEQYGVQRVAAFLQPVSQDFALPSPSPNGKPLDEAARGALMQRYGAQPFFSRELCAKYFTYTDEAGQAHFVLYDDQSTLEAKLMQLSALSVPAVFVLWPDIESLLTPP